MSSNHISRDDSNHDNYQARTLLRSARTRGRSPLNKHTTTLTCGQPSEMGG